jgi:signal transduction histidine kinase
MKTIRKKNIYILLFLLILTVVFFLFAGAMRHSDNRTEKPSPQQGALDLSYWNTVQNGIINLSGEWEFYWQKLLSYNDLHDNNPKPDLLVKVPDVWNAYKINGKSLPGFGYATYRLKVENAQEGQALAIRMSTVSTAYNLYINDRLAASNGKIGMDKQHFKPEYRPVMVQFTPTSRNFDIILQVANFSYSRGGAWNSIFMGSADNVAKYDKTIGYKDMFLVGAFLIMALYFLCIFLLRKEDRGGLYFVMLCLIAISRTIIYGDYIINRILPWTDYPVIVAIDYVTLLWFPVALVSLIGELFPEQISLKLKRQFVFYAAFMSLFIMLSPIRIFTSLTYPIEAATLAIAAYAVVCNIRAFSKAKADSAVIFAGALAVTLGGIHDVLYQNNIIFSSFGELSSFGFLIMLFLQAYILAKRFKESADKAIASELAFLQAQIKPHFLYNSLNTFVSISLYDADKARNLMMEFGNYLRRSFDFKDLSQLAPLKNELELVRSYLEIEKARFEERIEAAYDLPDDLEARVPILMLQPIVENAVVHGILPKDEGGRIEIYIKRDDMTLYFKVKDNGIGMEPEKKDNIFKREYGSGVGLSNIDNRLRKLYGQGLKIDSSPGIGTEVTWCIPVNRRESERIDQSSTCG